MGDNGIPTRLLAFTAAIIALYVLFFLGLIVVLLMTAA